MKLTLPPKVTDYLQDLKKKDIKKFNLAKKQLVLFQANPKHPSLRIHKLAGNLKDTWSLSIGLKIRLVYIIKNGEAWGIKIGTHDEVYR